MTEAESGLGSEEARRQLYDLMRKDTDVQTKAAEAITLGQQYLDVDNAHLTYIDPAANYWEIIESTDPPDSTFPVGLSLDLGTTYCRRTINQTDPIALHNAPEQGWADDPAFDAHGLHTYHGVAVEVAGQVYGTACFVADQPRSTPFTDDESMFADLIGRLLGQAIEHHTHRVELTERAEMVDVLCRVLRHNLRNDLTTIRGQTEHIQSQLPEDLDVPVDPIYVTIDKLTAVTDGARQISSLIGDSFDRRVLDIGAIIERTAADIDARYPDASITVEQTPRTQLRASPQLETAVRELIENAATHGGVDPSITVMLSTTEEDIEIEVDDDGPGLPPQEQAVLQSGDETPLKHGSGLGLWLVYWIVRRHEGAVDPTVSDAGTTVTIRLPYGPNGAESNGRATFCVDKENETAR